jgi:hypothetical protein
MTRVVNVRHEPCDVYIGRPSIFGNPFTTGSHRSREGAIDMYRSHFYQKIRMDVDFKKAIQSLKGKTLGCYCKPLACHGDIFVEYLEP